MDWLPHSVTDYFARQKGLPFDHFLDGTLFVAAATLVIRSILLIWNLLVKWFRYHFLLKISHCQISFGPIRDLPKGCEMKCLLVRYGTDAYIEHLASQQEKYEGRLRNRIIRVSVVGQNEINYVRFQLRVHKRLGTQFKLYVDCRDQAGALEMSDYLRQLSDSVAKVDDPSNTADVWRVWYLLKQYGPVRTVEGYENNFYPAV